MKKIILAALMLVGVTFMYGGEGGEARVKQPHQVVGKYGEPPVSIERKSLVEMWKYLSDTAKESPELLVSLHSRHRQDEPSYNLFPNSGNTKVKGTLGEHASPSLLYMMHQMTGLEFMPGADRGVLRINYPELLLLQPDNLGKIDPAERANQYRAILVDVVRLQTYTPRSKQWSVPLIGVVNTSSEWGRRDTDQEANQVRRTIIGYKTLLGLTDQLGDETNETYTQILGKEMNEDHFDRSDLGDGKFRKKSHDVTKEVGDLLVKYNLAEWSIEEGEEGKVQIPDGYILNLLQHYGTAIYNIRTTHEEPEKELEVVGVEKEDAGEKGVGRE